MENSLNGKICIKIEHILVNRDQNEKKISILSFYLM
jgi:hypothetical protein